METFTGRVRPGAEDTREERVEEEVEDLHQDIARSSFADMLHDRDRNNKYYAGIRAAVARVKARGEPVIVLDIGTGTGLLSMMAVTAGADFCYAVEMFGPMAEAARCIVDKNGFADRIRVLHKHSRDVTVGPGGDMRCRANVLVTELFDTELIGEGALPSYEHAHEHLMDARCEAVPHRARVYAQLVHCEDLWNWTQLRPVTAGSSGLLPPPALARCPGSHAVCDVQLSQVPPRSFTALSPLLAMFSVDFSKPVSSTTQTHSCSFQALCSGQAQVVLSWWDISMDPGDDIVCSMAPSWTYEDPRAAPWRDHWMQSVYFLPEQSAVTKGEDLCVSVTHDDYSLWYGLSRGRSHASAQVPRPGCTCLAHLVWNRPRFGELNDGRRTQSYVQALRRVLQEDSVCLSVSDGSLLPLLANLLGAKTVFSVESFRMARQVIEQLLEANQLTGCVELLGGRPERLSREDLRGQQVSVLMGEPFFSSSLLPWHSLYFWYCRSALAALLRPGAAVLPCSASLHVAAVEFEDLWKIRAPCGTCEGFDVSPMDQMIQRSVEYRESREAEPHSLWEYPCRALTHSRALMTFDFTQCVPDQPLRSRGALPFTRRGRCHAAVLWMEYHLTEDITVSAGLTAPVGAQGQCQWSPHQKQAVFFFSSPRDAPAEGAALSYSFTFDPSPGHIQVDFNFEPAHGKEATL